MATTTDTSFHPVETNGGTITSWIPMTESWSPQAQCYSTFLASGSDFVIFDPSLGNSFTSLQWCLPGEITSSFNQPSYGATTTNLGPFTCPSDFIAAWSGSSLSAGTTAIQCCPAGYTYATLSDNSASCTSAVSSGQTLSYADSAASLTSTILSTQTYAKAFRVYGFDFDSSASTSTVTDFSTSSQDTTTAPSITSSISLMIDTSASPSISNTAIYSSSSSPTTSTFWAVGSSSAAVVAVQAPSQSAATAGKNTLSGGAIGGIVAGTAIIILCMLGAVLLVLKHRRGNNGEWKGEASRSEVRSSYGGGLIDAGANGEGENIKGFMYGDGGEGYDASINAGKGKTPLYTTDTNGLRVTAYERPADVRPVCELHGESRPAELGESRWAQALNKEAEGI